MKRWNRILAALLAAVLLCGAWTAFAEMELELGLDSLESNAGIELEIDPESIEGELGDIAELPEDLEIDGLGRDGLDTGIAVDENILAGETETEGAETAASNSFTDGDYDHDAFEIDENGVLVKYKGKGGDVVIPDGVTSIGKKAFSDKFSLISVTIPNSVTSIGEYAFWWCTRLISVTIPNSVTSIGEYAFRTCISLTSVAIPNSVTSIGKSAFEDCDSLTSVAIPDSVTSIEDYTFSYCDSLSSVTIPDSVTSIGKGAFEECDDLIIVTIPISVTSIGEDAFAWCKCLTSITILAKSIDIDIRAFRKSFPAFHIISGSNAIEWAEDHGYIYDIFENLLSAESLQLKSEQTYKLKVLGNADSNVTWSSSDKSVATVDNGKVTAKKVGKCVISAKLSSGETLKCKVSVYDPAELNDTTLSLYLGDTYKLKVTGLLNRKVTWSSSNTAVATVKNGKITPKKAGKCVISAKLGKGKYLAARTLKCKVTVTDPAALSAEKLTISAVDSARIKLTGALKRKVTWSTSNGNVVKITKSDNGSASIKAVKTGAATITAKVEGGKTLKCVVTVVNPLTIKEGWWDDDYDDLSSWEIGVKFTNNSNKKIIYVTFDILQYNNRGDKLNSPYDYYYYNNDIDPHSYRYNNYTVNDDTRSVKFIIREVTFADKSTWRP